MRTITPCLWFDNNAEEAVSYYMKVFKNSKIISTTKYDQEGAVISGRPEGSLLTISFVIENTEFLALNGGPIFNFTPAISLISYCDTQEEIDFKWKMLTDGGKEEQCGWLTDKFGISWQIIPTILDKLLTDPDPEKAKNVSSATYKMIKFDINKLLEAYNRK